MNTFEVFLQGISTGEIKMSKIYDRNVLTIVKDFLTPKSITFEDTAKDFQMHTYTDEKSVYVLRDEKIYTFCGQKLEKIITLKIKPTWIDCFAVFNNKIFIVENCGYILMIFDMEGVKLHEIEFEEYISCFIVNSRGIFICSDSRINSFICEYDHGYNLIRTFTSVTSRMNDSRILCMCFSEYHKKFYVLLDENIIDIYDENGIYLKSEYDRNYPDFFVKIFAYKNFIVRFTESDNIFMQIYDEDDDGDMKNLCIKHFEELYDPNNWTNFHMAENSDIYVFYGEKILIYTGWI